MRSTLHATVVTAGLLALVTTSAAIAAVPSVAQCTTPQPWAHSNAGVVVGNGTAASCTASALATAVAQGGYVTFNCGTRAASIAVNQTINISASTPTVIDGQGKITLDGRQAARIFQVQNGNALSVRNLKLQNGSSVQPASNTQYAPGTWGGGAIKVSYRGKLEVINSQFLGNRSSIGGGAIFAGSDTDVTIVKSAFSRNTSWLGGALYTQLSRLTIVNSEFVGNQAINAPAGFPDGDQFGNSGAIDTDGASLAGYLNAAAGGATLSVCGTVVRNNTAANSGGGATLWAYAPDTIDVRYSTFANNIAYGGPAGGARISLGFGDTTHSGTTITTPGIINIEETSFISNRAEKSNAGALYMDCYGPSCNVSNSTFYGNYAKGVGAAIQHVGWQPSNGDQGKTTVRFNNVTFAENTPGSTLFGSGFDIRNSVFYSKTERAFCSDQSSIGNNLIEYSAAGGLFHSCLTTGLARATDPLLGAPAANGGPTPTQLPAANSPVRNLGSNCRTIDQRGVARDTAVCDVGAVEIK